MRLLAAVRSAVRGVAAFVSNAGPRFWLMVAGLAMAHRGAEQLHPGAGFLLVGLLVVWDATRNPSK